MATFLAIQQRVQTWLRDLPADTVAEIPTLINEAQRELQRAHNFRAMEALQNFVTVPGSSTLGTIADFKEARRRPQWNDADGTSHGMEWEPSRDRLIQLYNSTSTGAPRHIYHGGVNGTGVTTLWIFPMSDSHSGWPDLEYRVYVPYWCWLPDLSAPADSNWFTLHADKYLRLHAVGWATLLNIDEGRGTVYLKMADNEAQRLISADKSAKVQQPVAFPYSDNAASGVGPSGWSW